MEVKEYITLAEFAKRNRWVSVGGLEWLVREATGGIEDLNAVFVSSKKGILINEEKFLKYYNSNLEVLNET